MTDFSRPVRPKWLGSFAGPTVIPRFAVPCNLGDLNSELCCKPSAATQKSPRTDGSSLIGLGTCSRAFGRFLIRLLLFYFFGPLLFFRPLFLVPLQASPLLLCSLFWQRFLGQRRFFIFFLVFFLVFIFIFIFTFIPIFILHHSHGHTRRIIIPWKPRRKIILRPHTHQQPEIRHTAAHPRPGITTPPGVRRAARPGIHTRAEKGTGKGTRRDGSRRG